MAQVFYYPPSAIDTSNPLHVIVDSSALPTGASTSALQTAGNASLTSIDAKLTSPIVVTTGGLTDAELRASPVDVDTGLLQGLTDAELRASPVDVDTGLVQSLTDAQLRATPVPVSGTVSTGGLTDAELRASPVDVDTGLLQGLTDAQLRASPVPVSGTVSTGGLTDAELRATPVPVSVSGVATAANQVTGNASLSSIDTKLSSQATAANQTTGNASLSSIDGKTPALGQALAASSVPVVMTAIQLAALSAAPTGRSRANAPARNDYTSVNVTTAAFVELVASTSATTNMVEVFDSSGQTLALAVGAAASEVIQFYIFPGGNGQIPLAIPSGSRVSIKAISATASVGEIDVNFYT